MKITSKQKEKYFAEFCEYVRKEKENEKTIELEYLKYGMCLTDSFGMCIPLGAITKEEWDNFYENIVTVEKFKNIKPCQKKK